MILYLLQGVTLGFSAAVSPGPFQAFLLAQTLRNGWRRTLPAALAPLLSDGPIIALVLLLLTQTPDWFLSALQIGGGFFLLYLAWGAWQSYRQGGQQTAVTPESTPKNLLKATLINGLSPAPYIFWGVLAGPIFLQGWRESAANGFIFILGFYATLVAGFALFVLLFAGAGQFGPRVTRGLSALSAVALLLFGLYQLGQAGGRIINCQLSIVNC